MPPVETDARSVLLALYVPADLDAHVEQARERAGLDRSKFIRSCVTRQAKMPVRGVDPIQAGPKVRRNVRWHPDEVALVEAYAAAAWQEHGRRLGVEDAAVELLHVAIVDPPESVASPAPARPSGELRDLVAEVVREELRPVLDLLRSINAALNRPAEVRTQTDTEPIPATVGELTRSFVNIGVNRRKSATAKPGGRRQTDPK